jgi:hypothetical protein
MREGTEQGAVLGEATSRFSSVLASRAERFAAEHKSTPLTVRLPSDIHPDEAVGFMRALDSGIVELSDSGRCSLPSIHRSSRKPTEPCLFGVRSGTAVYLAWREYITQVGALATLVLDYGWPARLVALDPRNWEFDVAGFDSELPTAYMHVAGETKKTQKELSRLVDQMLAASRARLTLGELGSSDGHKKYGGLLKERSSYFWAVAPGVRRAFGIVYESNAAHLEEIAGLPCHSALCESSK